MSDRTIDRVAAATPTPVARKIKGLSDRAIAWIFVAPTIFLLLAINIFPLIWTIRLSFTNYRANRLNREPEFIGFRNYERILTDSDIWLNMQATAHFLFWTIALQVLIGFALMGVGTSIVFPLMISAAAKSEDRPSSESVAAVTMTTGAAMMLVPVLIGLVAENFGVRWAFLILLPAFALSLSMVRHVE